MLLFSSTLLQCSKKKTVLVWSKLVVAFISEGEAMPAVQIIATVTLAAAPGAAERTPGDEEVWEDVIPSRREMGMV